MGEGSATEVYFYHLERGRRSMTYFRPCSNGRSSVAGAPPSRPRAKSASQALDTLLWTYGNESFLPHGTARDGRASAQPIYLTAGDDNPNAAHVRFLVDGATLADASPYVRVAHVFDGRDQDAVARAREAWREAKARGNAVSYFQQDANGRWLEQA